MIDITVLIITYLFLSLIMFAVGYHKGLHDAFWKAKKEKMREDPDWTPGIPPPRPWPAPIPPGSRPVRTSFKEPEIERCHIEPEKPWERE
jgi:hypothetical protein